MMADRLAQSVRQWAPSDTGLLARTVTETWGPAGGTSGQKVMHMGDGRKIGNPGRSPRGTIAAFLRDYPEFRRFQRVVGMSRWQAWWLLPRAGKAKLQQERLAGNYGGGYQGVGTGKPAYAYQQEGSLPEWQTSAAAAGIKPTYFVTNGLIDYRQNDLPEIMSAFASAIQGA